MYVSPLVHVSSGSRSPQPLPLPLYRIVRHHGWAAARGDLSNPENKKEYEDVYSRVAAFFKSVQKN